MSRGELVLRLAVIGVVVVAIGLAVNVGNGVPHQTDSSEVRR